MDDGFHGVAPLNKYGMAYIAIFKIIEGSSWVPDWKNLLESNYLKCYITFRLQ